MPLPGAAAPASGHPGGVAKPMATNITGFAKISYKVYKVALCRMFILQSLLNVPILMTCRRQGGKIWLQSKERIPSQKWWCVGYYIGLAIAIGCTQNIGLGARTSYSHDKKKQSTLWAASGTGTKRASSPQRRRREQISGRQNWKQT